jgi:hypothetical protein
VLDRVLAIAMAERDDADIKDELTAARMILDRLHPMPTAASEVMTAEIEELRKQLDELKSRTSNETGAKFDPAAYPPGTQRAAH